MIEVEQSLSTDHQTLDSSNLNDGPLKILTDVEETDEDHSVKVFILLFELNDP